MYTFLYAANNGEAREMYAEWHGAGGNLYARGSFENASSAYSMGSRSGAFKASRDAHTESAMRRTKDDANLKFEWMGKAEHR